MSTTLKRYNPNAITETTRMCICRYHYRGDDLLHIAQILNRPEPEIYNILYECLSTNKYYEYVIYGETDIETVQSTVKALQHVAKNTICNKDIMLHEGSTIMIKNACINCTERTAYCHATCEKYREYKEQLAIISMAKHADREYNEYQHQPKPRVRKRSTS